MESLNKLRVVNVKDIDKSTVFIAVDSVSWRTPNKISVQNLLDSVIIDPCTLKIEVHKHYIAPSVFGEPYVNQNISYNSLPKNASELSAMHLAVDDNYLYVWSGNRWKRTSLLTW